MADERFVSACDLSSSSSSSISSPVSTASSASSDDITDSGNSSWGFSPPALSDGNGDGGALFHMKSLIASLPSRKRGLSNFFTGKSQSFTSLADVKCAEDLAKPEKKLKSCHSWASTAFNNQTIRSSIFSAGSAESIRIPRKAANGAKMGKKGSRSKPANSGLTGNRQCTLIYRSIPSDC